MILISQPLVSHLIWWSPVLSVCLTCFYVSRMGILLSQNCWGSKGKMIIILLSSSLFLYVNKWRLWMWTIAPPYTFLNIYIPAIIPTTRAKVASPPSVGSLLSLLWGLQQLLDVSHCTRPEGRGIFCAVHCYRPSVSLWHLADSETSANVVRLKVSNLLTLGPCIWYSSHQLHFFLSFLTQ